DRARGIEDVVADLGPLNTDRELNGDIFHIERTVQWVSVTDSPLQCGASAGGEKLRFKRVNVRVTWEGMRASAAPVQSDTIINPRERVNDPAKGTLLISVLKAEG